MIDIIMTVSTSHVSECDLEKLSSSSACLAEYEEGVIVDLHIDDTIVLTPVAKKFLDDIKNKFKCRFVRFDADGDILAPYTLFDW